MSKKEKPDRRSMCVSNLAYAASGTCAMDPCRHSITRHGRYEQRSSNDLFLNAPEHRVVHLIMPISREIACEVDES